MLANKPFGLAALPGALDAGVLATNAVAGKGAGGGAASSALDCAGASGFDATFGFADAFVLFGAAAAAFGLAADFEAAAATVLVVACFLSAALAGDFALGVVAAAAPSDFATGLTGALAGAVAVAGLAAVLAGFFLTVLVFFGVVAIGNSLFYVSIANA